VKTAAAVAWAALGWAASAAAMAQGGPDELWNMTTKMEMAGMQMPASTQQVCMKKGETRPESLQQDKNCKVTDQKMVGNKMTWKMVCTGKDAMSGSGEMTRSADSMNGRMSMKDKDGDEMTVVYSGKRAGGCNAQDQEKKGQAMVAQGNAQMAQMCRESVDKYTTPMFEGKDAICKAQKTEFCGRVTEVSQSMRAPAGFRKAIGQEGLRDGGWERAAGACGVKAAAIRGEACGSGVKGRDWGFVSEYCPAETKKLAAEHCAGREYTVAMNSEYKTICAKQAGGFAQPQRAAAKPAAAPTATDVVKDGAKEGVRALKNLFGK
jgi:hypothetical protein